MDTRRLLRFGDFTLDTSQGLLHYKNERLRIAPKLIELLTLLVERRGAIVSNAQIIRTLWPNTVVEDSGLSRNISMLRKHLSAGTDVQYIENIPKRGYRFTAEVIELDRETLPPCDACVQETSQPAAAPPALAQGITQVAPTREAWWRTRASLGLAVVCFLAIAATVLAGHGRERAEALRFGPITTNAAALPVLSAAISPDARYLAYVEATQYGAAAHVRLLSSPRVHPLHSLPGVVPSTIRWYGDNTRLLLSGFDSRSRQYVAWSTSVLGEPPTRVLTNAYRPALSPDSKRIAFYRNRNELWLADGDGQSERLFATAANSSRFSLQPQFSGDGDYLLVGRRIDHRFTPIIEGYRLADGQRTVLFDPQDHGISDMLLLPTGELIVAALISRTRTRLLSMHVDFSSGTTSKPVTLAELDGITDRLHASADGRKITAVRDPGQTDIYLGDLDALGTSLTNVRRLTFDDALDRPSVWLPDNRTILFHSNRHGRNGIYKQSIDAVHAEPLVVDAYENMWPVVSPDQQWLWYFSMLPDPSTSQNSVRLMRRPLAGGPSKEFGSRPDPWRGLRCSKSGTCIRVEHEGAESIFYSFHPTDGSGRELARAPWVTPSSPYNWDISPDGDRIAFIDGATNVIGLLSLDMKPVKRTDLHVEGYQSLQAISWDSTGAGLYVACFDEDDHSTLHVSLQGSVKLLRHQPLGIGGSARPSPDGRHLLIADWTMASNVWLFER